MNKSTISLEEQLISMWQKGWPDYLVYPQDDHPSILQLSEKIASSLKVDPSTLEGYERIEKGLINIAIYCRYNMPWAGKNLHFFNRAFQTLYNEMCAKKRMEKVQSDGYNYNK